MTDGSPSPTPVQSTEKLYWTRPQDRTFTAAVTAMNAQRVALNRTLFYPEGGGQPCDSGTLEWPGGSAAVTEVQKDGQLIWHTLAGPLPPAGTQVTGTLDWAKRYRHSQRHTAEHLLAQAFWRVNPAFGVRSVSMRGPECTLDLAGQPGETHVAAAQALLTETLREGLSLETPLVPAGGLDAYPLRRPPQVQGEVRVVLFRGAQGEVWEASACGGTHLQSGVQAAPVVVLKTERVKGDLTRITFMAGEEATERLSRVYGQMQALARGFSVGTENVPGRVAELQAALGSAEAATAALRRTLAAQLLGQADWRRTPNGQAALIETEDEALLAPLLEVAAQQTDRPPSSLVAVLCSGGRCGVASGLPEYPANGLLKGWLAQSGGRGGGRNELAQGQAARPDDFRGAVQHWLDALPLPE